MVVLALLPRFASADALSLEDAIRRAWAQNPGVAASALQAEAARSEAEAARDARLPTVTMTARAMATDEPMNAFGLRLDQQRITAADFDPARLNAPDPVAGVGLGASLLQPIYTGGRLSSGRRAAASNAEAERNGHARRLQETALAVVEAYFYAEVAAEGLRHADDVLTQARETERFVRARNAQGLVLAADVARATSFRAQAEAERAAAAQRVNSARSALALLAGEEAAHLELSTPLVCPATAPDFSTASSAGRPDLAAARLRAEAAREAATAVRGQLLPQLFAQGSVETMRSDFDQGATWFSAALVARWNLALADARATRAAESRAAAASSALQWSQRQAAREIDEARRALDTARIRISSAREAITASETAREQRIARHRQGLLPLTDVLDAESGLAGARALLLRSLLEARIARAQYQLATGDPIEGVK